MRETGDREHAADLAAEVFAGVLLAAPRYEPQTPQRAAVGDRDRTQQAVDELAPWAAWRSRRVAGLGLEPVQLDDAALERVEELAEAGERPP